MSDQEHESQSLFAVLAPYLAGAVLVAVACMMLILRFLPHAATGEPPVVVSFDVIKYTNAQRAVASSFLKRDVDIAQANELLLNLPERTRKVIAEVAGPDVLVVVKQSVVQGQTEDITDEVLRRLGLPVNVPTSDATAYALDVAPTMFLVPPPERRPMPMPNENARSPGEEVLP